MIIDESGQNNILITGGAGMIGSHLIDEILLKNAKAKIFVLDDLSVGEAKNIPSLSNIELINGSVLDKKIIGELTNKVDIVYHLAAKKKGNDIDSSLNTLDTIVDSARNVLEACQKHSVRVVLASTSDVYGYGTSLPFNEKSPVALGPFNTRRWAYAAAKLYTEQLAYEFYCSGVDVRLIRYFGGFSERSSMTWRGGHIPMFVYNAYHDRDIIVHGDGTQTRCVTYGSDLAKGTLLAGSVEDISGELFNIGSEEEISVKDAAERVLSHFPDSRSKILHKDTDQIFGTYQEIQRRRPCLEKSRQILGYNPIIKFDEGISILAKEISKDL